MNSKTYYKATATMTVPNQLKKKVVIRAGHEAKKGAHENIVIQQVTRANIKKERKPFLQMVLGRLTSTCNNNKTSKQDPQSRHKSELKMDHRPNIRCRTMWLPENNRGLWVTVGMDLTFQICHQRPDQAERRKKGRQRERQTERQRKRKKGRKTAIVTNGE